jgi:hypothetical protein
VLPARVLNNSSGEIDGVTDRRCVGVLRWYLFQSLADPVKIPVVMTLVARPTIHGFCSHVSNIAAIPMPCGGVQSRLMLDVSLSVDP